MQRRSFLKAALGILAPVFIPASRLILPPERPRILVAPALSFEEIYRRIGAAKVHMPHGPVKLFVSPKTWKIMMRDRSMRSIERPELANIILADSGWSAELTQEPYAKDGLLYAVSETGALEL